MFKNALSKFLRNPGKYLSEPKVFLPIMLVVSVGVLIGMFIWSLKAG